MYDIIRRRRRRWQIKQSSTEYIQQLNKASCLLRPSAPAQYKDEYPYLREVDSLALANVQLNLQAAYKNFFDRKRKVKSGFPKFKSRKARNSYTTNNQRGTVSIIDDKYIKIPKIGKVKAVIHRKADADWKIKSATISKERDGSYYISILCQLPMTFRSWVVDDIWDKLRNRRLNRNKK